MAEKSKAMQKVTDAREAMRRRLDADNAKENDDDVMEVIAEEILNAESVDDVLSAGGTLGAEEMVDVPLRMERFTLRKSSDEYPEVEAFAVIQAVNLDTGEVIVITTGAFNIVTALIRLDELKAFPVECQIRQAGRALRLYRPERTTLDVPAAAE